MRRSRDKFLNFPTRSQRKSYISNLRTTKSRYGMPYLGLVVVVYSHLRVSLLISLVIKLCNQSRMLQYHTVAPKHLLSCVFMILQKWSFIGKWIIPHLPKGRKGVVWCRIWPHPLCFGDTKGSYASSCISCWSAWD